MPSMPDLVDTPGISISRLAGLLECGVRRAHQLAKQYAVPFVLDAHGYRLYDWREAFKRVPTRPQRYINANRQRSATLKARRDDNDMAITAAAEADDWRRT